MKIAEIENLLKEDKQFIFDEKYLLYNNRYEGRILSIVNYAKNKFSDGDYHIVVSPGRSEICGNHTDHQKGHIIAAALDIDNIGLFKKNDLNKVRFFDDKFMESGEILEVDITDLECKDEEANTTKSLIRGIAYKIKNTGFSIGGFDIVCDSKVLMGSGISSSACFENMIVEVFNYLYADEKIDEKERAKISRFAENEFFKKPCGLMDQMSISVGGLSLIDFKTDEIKKYNFNFKDFGYQLLLVNTKSDHKDLSSEYATMPNEMKDVAKYFNKEYLSEVDENDFYNNIKNIRDKVKNDRAILRTIHYFEEEKRVLDLKKNIEDIIPLKNIKQIDLSIMIKRILEIIKNSGNSSYKYLQNVYSENNVKEQSLSVALAISEKILKNDGAYRVHGGGLSGTIQAIVPDYLLEEYETKIKNIFGDDSILEINIREYGTKTIL